MNMMSKTLEAEARACFYTATQHSGFLEPQISQAAELTFDPLTPATVGDFVMLHLHPDGTGQDRVICRLDAVGTMIVGRLLDPPIAIRLQAREVVAIHKCIEIAEAPGSNGIQLAA